jgi:hypothetical protein
MSVTSALQISEAISCSAICSSTLAELAVVKVTLDLKQS